ncbi:cysteine--tRNA ligase [Candidatus Saccharibacteria bacterium]|nr:cysteine--tRNA ligase [Candidatus Saccharibacteria bacterium]MBR6122820.1 cysteine--tRNA ligase [Candidatus Saccharibacteria bacterium]
MLKLYNTATKKLEEFKPQNPNKVKIYTCGPTVYSTPHLGNYAAYIYWDLLLRTLYANDYKPYRVLNLTDVGHLVSDADDGEDKLEKGAKREGKSVWEIADHYIDIFEAGFSELGLLDPAVWARATDYIEQSKALVQKLIDNGYTYETSDGVYFDTAKFPDYAKFARLDLDHQKAGARVAFSSEKRNVSDFAVWKFIKPGELHAMRWDFLGKPGYPGWHLECSTIIHEELKEPIDIHTGGVDHIPVHHTNEIAQTFGAFNEPLANYWLHCNFLTINGEKISKSLGNIITLEDLKAKGFTPADFKLWLYQGHYRAERNFTWEDLAAAKARRLSWRNAYAACLQDKFEDQPETPLKSKLLEFLNNDLGSASAFAYIDSQKSTFTSEDWELIDKLFALDLTVPPSDLNWAFSDYEKYLAPLIRERNRAREKKDWATADKIRDELAEKNITLLDTPTGTIWQYIK